MMIFTPVRARVAVATLTLTASVGLLFTAGCTAGVLGDHPESLVGRSGGAGTGDSTTVLGGAGSSSCNVAGTLGSGGVGGNSGRGTGGTSLPPVLPAGPVVGAADPPPPMSGGTLIVLGDGRTAVAADPDRDQIWIVDLQQHVLKWAVTLAAHDEPGRLVEDAGGRVHVALRRGGALVTIDPQAGIVLYRRSVCAVPRGVAYDAGRDLVYVACMGGELVSFPAAGGAAVRTLSLDNDLRDVVLDGDNLLVSRFRTAHVLVVDVASGQVIRGIELPGVSDLSTRAGAPFTPSAAWRMLPARGGGALMLHQRGESGTIVAGPGGYGSNGLCDSIVHSAMTPIKVGQDCPQTPSLAGMVLAIDFAVSSDGSRTAIIAAGNAQNPQLPRLFVAGTGDVTSPPFVCSPDGVHAPAPMGGTFGTGVGGTFGTGVGGTFGASSRGAGGAAGGTASPDSGVPPAMPQPTGEVEAVAFDGNDRVVIQTREPATLQIPELGLTIGLSDVSRFDTGHAIFHANSGAGIACASCHGEGHEDGRIWEFDCLGTRRTMSISGGITTRVPYHWSGDLADFSSLMQEVYVGRMSGENFGSDVMGATLSWIDSIPRLPPIVGDSGAVARGQTLFADPAHGCSSCHNGPNLSNNTLRDVGTGGIFKVPALTGVAWQAPYMHDGCATTLTDRFGPCGGGDKHGVTSNLSSAQISDLVAYLQSL